MEFLIENIEGIEVYHTQSGFHQTAQSWQFSNPSMWRPGTNMWKVARERQKKASKILSSLNATGSYTSEYGIRYSKSPSGRMTSEAVFGEALEITKRIEEAGGNEAVFGFSGDEMALILFESMSPEGMEDLMEMRDKIFSIMYAKIDEYETALKDAASNINYSPVPVIVI